jgi:hypothetical protein
MALRFAVLTFMLMVAAFVFAGTLADGIELKAHETTRLHIGQTAVLRIPSEREYEREYHESADGYEKVKLPIPSKRRYEIDLAGDALSLLNASSCERSARPDEFDTQTLSCKPSATLVFRANHAERATFVLTPTDGNPKSRHCIDCVAWRYFIEVVP